MMNMMNSNQQHRWFILFCSTNPPFGVPPTRKESKWGTAAPWRPLGVVFFLLFGTMEPWPISSFPEQLQYSFSCFILRNLRWLLYKQKLNMWYVWLVYAEWEYLFFFWLIPPGNLRNMVHWVWRSPSWWRQFQRVAWMVASTNGI